MDRLRQQASKRSCRPFGSDYSDMSAQNEAAIACHWARTGERAMHFFLQPHETCPQQRRAVCPCCGIIFWVFWNIIHWSGNDLLADNAGKLGHPFMRAETEVQGGLHGSCSIAGTDSFVLSRHDKAVEGRVLWAEKVASRNLLPTFLTFYLVAHSLLTHDCECSQKKGGRTNKGKQNRRHIRRSLRRVLVMEKALKVVHGGGTDSGDGLRMDWRSGSV